MKKIKKILSLVTLLLVLSTSVTRLAQPMQKNYCTFEEQEDRCNIQG